MPNDPNNLGTGWFLKFTSDESDLESDLVEFLENNGYSPAPDGIKELIEDTIYKKEKPKPGSRIVEAIKENPEEVQQALAGIGNLATSLLNKKLFKK